MQFDPAQASGTAASFSGLLAAIVLAVLGTLAVSSARDAGSVGTEVRHDYPLSLSLGTPLLAALLTDTYMFVLLNGARVPGEATTEQVMSAARTAALLFAICGSLLAVAAAGTLLFVWAVICENVERAPSLPGAAGRATLAWGASLAALFLLFGYDDIRSTFYSAQNDPAWWVYHFLFLYIPLVAGFNWWNAHQDSPGPHLADGPNDRRKASLRASASLVWFSIIPAVTFLVASNHAFDGSRPYDGFPLTPLTLLACLWSGLSFGALLAVTPRVIGAMPR